MSGKNRPVLLLLAIAVFSLALFGNSAEDAKISDESQLCIDCHLQYTPGIVSDWKKSRHSRTTLNEALSKKEIERRVSISETGTLNGDIVVGCYECHSMNPDVHKDNFEHFGYAINAIVSPNDCRSCHPEEASQYSGSKKAHALDILRKNKTYDLLVNASLGIPNPHGDNHKYHKATENQKNETCFACHGTEVEVKGLKTIDTDLGEMEIPDLANYPNTGVGRINPDGSKGSCTSCHPRHSFSIEVARDPATCAQCHLEPDVPAYDVYIESKHGNIFKAKGKEWNFENVPWQAGEDFTAPTCATCHNSLVVDAEGNILAERTHDFGSRLWVRIFGLPYSHPQPKDGRTWLTKLSDGTQLPVSLDGSEFADSHLISPDEMNRRRDSFKKVCGACHGSGWADGHFTRLDSTLKDTDAMVKVSTEIMLEYWKKNPEEAANPFDGLEERWWTKQWLYYMSSIRYASAMSGPDYATFKDGWYESNINYLKIKKSLSD